MDAWDYSQIARHTDQCHAVLSSARRHVSRARAVVEQSKALLNQIAARISGQQRLGLDGGQTGSEEFKPGSDSGLTPV